MTLYKTLGLLIVSNFSINAQDVSTTISQMPDLHMFSGSTSGSTSITSLEDKPLEKAYFSGNVGYAYRLTPNLQLVFDTGVSLSKEYKYYNFKVGATYNFLNNKEEIHNAWYVSLLPGVEMVNPKYYSSSNHVNLTTEVGKRFSLSKNLSWSPSLGYEIKHLNSNDSYRNYKLNLFKLNLTF